MYYHGTIFVTVGTVQIKAKAGIEETLVKTLRKNMV